MSWNEAYRETLAPHPTLREQLTLDFYDWERRGRGWQIWPYPVTLEPPFRPFLGHFMLPVSCADDAKRPTFWSSLVESLRDGFRGRQAHHESVEPPEDLSTEPEPSLYWDESEITEVRFSLPPHGKVAAEAANQFLLALSRCTHPLSFEIIGLPHATLLQVASRESDAIQVKHQLKADFPEASLETTERFLRQRWHTDLPRLIVDFGLSQEFMRPLRTVSNFDPDPLVSIVGALEDLGERELALCQVLFEAAREPWTDSILRAVSDDHGRSFFADAPEMLPLTRAKVERPLFAAVIRVAAQSPLPGRAQELLRSVSGALTQFADPRSNELIPLTNEDYDYDLHEEDLLQRRTHRSGMLLNAAELVSLVHPPSLSVRTEKLSRETRKTKAVPASLTGHALVLGENLHQSKRTQVSVSREDRLRHAHVVGATGTGKSTLLLNLITQDIAQGNGVGVIDPHGDLVDEALGRVPRGRWKDVVLFDAADADCPVGFNILSAHSDLEKTILTSDLGTVFRRFATSWGDQMTSLLGNAVSAFVESDRGGTLLDLRRFLIEREFRAGFLAGVTDPQVRYWWEKEFPLLKGAPQASILTRLDTFLRPKLVRNIVAQKDSKLRFDEILNGGKILLVKLAQGLIGEENAHLLGAFLVSKLHQVVMSRQEVPDAARKDFFLYIDEFQHFVTPSLASILSGARKYHLGLILAHQDLRQLWSRDPEVASAVIANPSIRVCFRLGDFDAPKLKSGFASFDAADLQTLGVGEAIARVGRADHDFNLHTLPLAPIAEPAAIQTRAQLVALSRAAYGTPRAEVEAAQEALQPVPSVAPPVAPAAAAAAASPASRQRSAAPAPAKPEPSAACAVLSSPPEPASGRGGAQHKYLQQLVKKFAEDKGWLATVEKPVLKGMGNVDIALEREGASIACEISVTSTPEQELKNVQKCLAAGYDEVVLIVTERKIRAKLEDYLTRNLGQNERGRVKVELPEELLASLEERAAKSAGKEETVKGYKVKVRYRALGESEKRERTQAITRTIGEALKRLRGKP